MKYRLKYYSLSKEEKAKLLADFQKTDNGNGQIKRLKRLLIVGILCVLFSIFMIITNTGIIDIIASITLFVVGIVFIVCSYRIKIRDLNNFLIKKKK